MKKKSAFLKAGVAFVLVLGLSAVGVPAMLAYSTEQAEEVIEVQELGPASYEKTEVVYATLSPSGSVEGVYVVNQFDVKEAGEVVDYGAYETVANLTDQTPLAVSGEKAVFGAPEGAFYYQGNVPASGAELPWDVRLSYTLDGKFISPEELAGKSGKLGVHVTTTPVAGVDASFCESFMMQITFTLNGDTTTDIVAEGATIASAGRNRTIAFTVLPGQDGDCVLEAQVTDFEMSGVQFAALPYSVAMEIPDTSELTEGIGQLSGAVDQLNDGAAALSDGASDLSEGAAELASGSSEFDAGLSELNANAVSLVEGSSQFNDALQQMNEVLGGIDMEALGDLDSAQLAAYLRSSASALTSTAELMSSVYATYSPAYQSLDAAMADLGSSVDAVSEGDLAAVRDAAALADESAGEGGAGAQDSASRVINVYDSASSAVNAYGDGSAFQTANDALAGFQVGGGMYTTMMETAGLMNTVAGFLESDGQTAETIDQMIALVDGMSQLSAAYGQFHEGLVQFADGLNQLTTGYGELDRGVSDLADGVSEFDEGTADFASGVSDLNDATIDLPDTMSAEIDAMMENYSFPEFDPISFVDERNENVVAVQFVLTTEPIQVVEPEAEEPVEEEELTIIDRFFALFQ